MNERHSGAVSTALYIFNVSVNINMPFCWTSADVWVLFNKTNLQKRLFFVFH